MIGAVIMKKIILITPYCPQIPVNGECELEVNTIALD